MSLDGLVLLFEIGTKALPSWDFEDEVEQSLGRPCRQRNGRSKRTCGTHLIHRPARDIIPPLGGVHNFLLLDLIPHGFHAAAAACSRVQRNSVPSTQMRCIITANRRARATIAFFMPRRLAICVAQALSQDHFVERTNRISGRFVEHDPHHLISAAGYSATSIDLTGLILGAR